jgi:hypothetical protein
MRIILGLLLIWLGLVPAAARETQPPPVYSDDRSDGAALVRSLYNAVSRHEYARAWSYFETPPAKDFDAFVKGYDDTLRVDVVTGRVSSEGAAGSIFSEVPVAIRATDAKGETKVFTGCYTVKAVNPQIQEPPFHALMIEKAKLKLSDNTSLAGAAPDWCGEGEAPKETAEEELTRVAAIFTAQQRTACSNLAETGDQKDGKPAVYELKTRLQGETANDPERLFRLYEFACSSFAYNFSTVYYLADDYGEVKQLSFAEPRLDIKYGDEQETKLTSLSVNGYTSKDELINSSFDEKTFSIKSFDKWRGVGDASSSGTWTFVNGQFVLTNYEVDPTLDGEMTPIPLIVNGKLKNTG